jgi:hypothetical protein
MPRQMTGRMSDIIGSALGMSPEQGASGQEGQETDPQKSELAESLREYTGSKWGKRHLRPVDGWPEVREAPSLAPTPFILGADTARYVEQLRALDPRILERIGEITTGPNLSLIETLVNQDRSDLLGVGNSALPRVYGRYLGDPAMVVGQFHMKRRSIYLSPHLRKKRLFKALAHELSHGYGTNEENADRIDEEAARFFLGDYDSPPSMGDIVNSGK